MTPAEITEWLRLKIWMEYAKAREAQLRVQIADAHFTRTSEGAFAEGTQNIVADGFKIKLSAKMNYEVTDAAKVKELGFGAILKEAKPEMSLTAYRLLSAEDRLKVSQGISVKPGAISLEVEKVQ